MHEPPYAADTRARGWRFELDMEKVKASDTWLRARSGALKGALLLLWSEAWQQTPCGSLPDDDELVALLIDMPPATLAKHRSVLMRGWSRAGDGRLYHETITKRVLAMLEKRAKDAARTAGRRGRTPESDPSPPGVTRDIPVTPTRPDREFDTKHQAPSSQAPEEEKHPPTPRKRGKRASAPANQLFERFYASYPRKVAPDAARKAFERIAPDETTVDAMVRAVKVQGLRERMLAGEKQFVPHPATWLNDGRWKDAPDEGATEAGEWWETRRGAEAKAAELGLAKWDECSDFRLYVGKVRNAMKAAA